MPEEFSRAYWEQRYEGHGHGHGQPFHGRAPNAQLVAETGDLPPGTALDAGAGEGTEALWLASRGWRVTAVDIAEGALERARRHAAGLDRDVADRIAWVRADLTDWTPRERFDLVCSHYAHPQGPPQELYRRLGEAVAPCGTLLVVGHHPSDRHSRAPHAGVAGAHVTAEEIARALDPREWEVVTAETRSRTVTVADGREVAMSDAVLRARRHG
ncbi:bifunctional 2-polyprenyl-6-hydroxyphenol methylase/3-demethylubiquinol 3-O-methyltransferase UbiG [Nocardiopsis sp. NRRL B-16309]|uniref:class I SAM-dependent methyltransferase n=1 Tax=Nocardiopsis sp. NRRL B-16309 TaxID=1519494 RepID=UPI0006AFB4DB|nr:class I SAM-dependent methyltransferase [Nocardiopsis sp. NRRL B-16309]KOX15719.1 methyltransferase [Nocardiopsis sp. NRRL B-16309]